MMDLMYKVVESLEMDCNELERYGTNYRKTTSKLSLQLINLISTNIQPNQLFKFTKTQFVNDAKRYLNVDDERAKDVGKFVFVHVKEVTFRENNNDLCERAKELTRLALMK